MPRQRNPWLAAAANLVVPGLGFLYTGSFSLALAWPLCLVVAVVLSAAVVLWLPLPPLNALAFWLLVPLTVVVGPLLGWRAARRARNSFQPTRWNRGWSYLTYSLIVLLALNSFLDYVVRPHLIEAFRIPAGSMEPALLIGDYLIVDKRRPTVPQRNRPVVFESVEEPGLKVVKRIVAIAGDTIQATDSGIIVNGRRDTSRVYLVEGSEVADTFSRRLLAGLKARYAPLDTTTWHLGAWGPLVVPGGHFFALGDNENASYDSRYYGPVPDTHILGWPLMIYLSYDSSGVRWRRLGHLIE